MIVASLAILLAAGSVWAAIRERDSLVSPPGSIDVGDQLPSGVLVRADDLQTLALWIDSNCGACAQSASFYRDLSSLSRRVHFVVLTPQSEPEIRAFLDQSSIRVDAVVSLADRSTIWKDFGSTPTALHLDARGRVLGRWVGKLSPAQELKLKETFVGK